MRRALRELILHAPSFSHVGLAYDVLAPIESAFERDERSGEDRLGKGTLLDKGDYEGHNPRDEWFEKLEKSQIDKDYQHFYDRWYESFLSEKNRAFSAALQTRLLVGHGNPSPSQVGLTVHQTWGVPCIPGSALKGLVASYMQATYGPEKLDFRPWDKRHTEPTRAPYQGVTWGEKSIEHGPGHIYRYLFGAPSAKTDEESYFEHAAEGSTQYPRGETQGAVVFHDALLIPDKEDNTWRTPFAQDVLTVHQKGYYDSSGGVWPNDYEDPVPVQFLTVRPGMKFLFVLSGPVGWTELAGRLLKAALCLWGVGGKTSAGYGHFDKESWVENINAANMKDQLKERQEAHEEAKAKADQARAETEAKESDFYQEFGAWLEENPDGISKTKMPGVILSDWAPRFEELDTASRAVIWELIRKKSSSNKKTKDDLAKLRALLESA